MIENSEYEKIQRENSAELATLREYMYTFYMCMYIYENSEYEKIQRENSAELATLREYVYTFYMCMYIYVIYAYAYVIHILMPLREYVCAFMCVCSCTYMSAKLISVT